MRNKGSYIIFTFVLCFSLSAYAVDAKLKVYASILPQAYVIERIAGLHVDVQVLVSPGQNPHTFEPMPRQVAAL